MGPPQIEHVHHFFAPSAIVIDNGLAPRIPLNPHTLWTLQEISGSRWSAVHKVAVFGSTVVEIALVKLWRAGWAGFPSPHFIGHISRRNHQMDRVGRKEMPNGCWAKQIWVAVSWRVFAWFGWFFFVVLLWDYCLFCDSGGTWRRRTIQINGGLRESLVKKLKTSLCSFAESENLKNSEM